MQPHMIPGVAGIRIFVPSICETLIRQKNIKDDLNE